MCFEVANTRKNNFVPLNLIILKTEPTYAYFLIRDILCHYIQFRYIDRPGDKDFVRLKVKFFLRGV